jgi:hypothetical protein
MRCLGRLPRSNLFTHAKNAQDEEVARRGYPSNTSRFEIHSVVLQRCVEIQIFNHCVEVFLRFVALGFEVGGLGLQRLQPRFLVFELLRVTLREGAFFCAAFQGLQIFADPLLVVEQMQIDRLVSSYFGVSPIEARGMPPRRQYRILALNR